MWILISLHSSLSQYVHNVDALNLSAGERSLVDAQIDRLYDDIQKGKVCLRQLLLMLIQKHCCALLVQTSIKGDGCNLEMCLVGSIHTHCCS